MAAVTLKQMCRFMFRWGLCIAAVEAWSVGEHYGAAACVGDDEDRKSRERAMDRLRLCYLGAAAIGCRFRGWQTPGEHTLSLAGMDQFAVRRQYDEEFYKGKDGGDYFCVTDADLSAEAWHGGAGGGSTPLVDGKRRWNFKLGYWIVMRLLPLPCINYCDDRGRCSAYSSVYHWNTAEFLIRGALLTVPRAVAMFDVLVVPPWTTGAGTCVGKPRLIVNSFSVGEGKRIKALLAFEPEARSCRNTAVKVIAQIYVDTLAAPGTSPYAMRACLRTLFGYIPMHKAKNTGMRASALQGIVEISKQLALGGGAIVAAVSPTTGILAVDIVPADVGKVCNMWNRYDPDLGDVPGAAPVEEDEDDDLPEDDDDVEDEDEDEALIEDDDDDEASVEDVDEARVVSFLALIKDARVPMTDPAGVDGGGANASDDSAGDGAGDDADEMVLDDSAGDGAGSLAVTFLPVADGHDVGFVILDHKQNAVAAAVVCVAVAVASPAVRDHFAAVDAAAADVRAGFARVRDSAVKDAVGATLDAAVLQAKAAAAAAAAADDDARAVPAVTSERIDRVFDELILFSTLSFGQRVEQIDKVTVAAEKLGGEGGSYERHLHLELERARSKLKRESGEVADRPANLSHVLNAGNCPSWSYLSENFKERARAERDGEGCKFIPLDASAFRENGCPYDPAASNGLQDLYDKWKSTNDAEQRERMHGEIQKGLNVASFLDLLYPAAGSRKRKG